MTFIALSKDHVQANVILYFHNEFRDPVSWFNAETDVREAYSYTDEQWQEVGPTLSRLRWMRRLDVQLEYEDMDALSTIGDISGKIWSKLNKVVIVTDLAASFDLRDIEVLAAPSGRGRRMAGTASKPKTKPKPQAKPKTKPKPKPKSKAKPGGKGKPGSKKKPARAGTARARRSNQ